MILLVKVKVVMEDMGVQGVQTVQFDFDCDWNKVTATLVDVTVTAGNKPKTCVFTFNFKSKQACFQV